MTRRRFYAPPIAFAADGQAVLLGADETRHLRDVLRSRSGDEVFVFDGAGREFRCEIGNIERDATQLRVLEEVRPASPESPLALTFGVALLKGEKFDLVIQKAAELGVNRIIPLETDRADVKLADKHDGFKRVTRWQRIALEAAKQSGRAQVPEICVPQSLTSGLASMKEQSGDGTLRLMFSERDGESFTQACSSVSEPPAAVVLVGPEGGWTDDEIHAARTAGFKVVTLQGRTLRAETAAIVVATLMQHRFGDLS